jgi:hypothetical protein
LSDATPYVTTCEERYIVDSVVMGMHKAVYVRDEDVDLWERAERYAKARRLPMSALVMTALERFLAAEEQDRGSVRK